VKLYIREPGTERLLRLVARTGHHRIAVLNLTRVEFHSAVRRREREGDLDGSTAKRLLKRFDDHIETRFEKQVVNDSLLDVASSLVDRYPLRAYDSVQLAGCLMLRAAFRRDEPTFVCADRRLIEVAEAEGITSLDPSP